MSKQHPTWSQSFEARAQMPGTPPLSTFLLRLISIKKTNLCLSADVSSTSELLQLAEEVGDSICLLKTHMDIIDDFSERTIMGLREIARRRRFLVFEDRKFGDIGSTVQKQYTGGPLSIVRWAAITNAHLFPGPAIVTALKQAASSAIAAYNTKVHTEISAGSPESSVSSGNSSPALSEHGGYGQISNPSPHLTTTSNPSDPSLLDASSQGRKPSIVSVSTTISAQVEHISPQPTPHHLLHDDEDVEAALDRLGNPPFSRALLLLAQMSSEGNMLTPEYTQKCVEVARQHKDFVMGFIAQKSLNTAPDDNFIVMTPGVNLPPPGDDPKGKLKGDGLGQQYRTPRQVIVGDGCDIVIVGRGIIKAEDRQAEAERYRLEAWRAYEERVTGSS